jgi:hypothetical protein
VLTVFVDPLAPRLEVFGSTLVGDRVKRTDPNLGVKRDIDISNLAGILILVAKTDVTTTV